MFLSYFVVMADQFSGLDTRVNHTRKIVHTCDLQHTCCFANKKDWFNVETLGYNVVRHYTIQYIV